jgi:hypothetical protein
VGGTCIKHSHHGRDGKVVVYGTCSVANKTRTGLQEVIMCPQRLYADQYGVLSCCAEDAVGKKLKLLLVDEYVNLKKAGALPPESVLLIGKKSGKEIQISKKGLIDLSIDWVLAHIIDKKLEQFFPCEVQSIDITGNYRDTWDAYSREFAEIPNSEHGMNWANVWKRLIPQIILKGSIATTSLLCKKGFYFVVPERVYQQFEKIVGSVASAEKPGIGVLTVMTYDLGPSVSAGHQRELVLNRTVRTTVAEFIRAFGSGQQLPSGVDLDTKVSEFVSHLGEPAKRRRGGGPRKSELRKEK